jgi:hypothetical protein
MRFIYLCRVAGRPGGTNLFPSHRRSRSIRDRVCQSSSSDKLLSLRSLGLETHTQQAIHSRLLERDYFLALEFARERCCAPPCSRRVCKHFHRPETRGVNSQPIFCPSEKLLEFSLSSIYLLAVFV